MSKFNFVKYLRGVHQTSNLLIILGLEFNYKFDFRFYKTPVMPLQNEKS
jgi:hypothetical protein